MCHVSMAHVGNKKKKTRRKINMKNVKIILIAAGLCTCIFANQRIDALGGDAGFWSGDKANTADFPATINDHDYVEFDGVGDDAVGNTATILWGDATTWGFSWDQTDSDTWFNIAWGNGDMGLNVGYINNDKGGEDDPSGFHVGYGQNFDWGELGVGFNSGDWDKTSGTWSNDVSSYWVNWRGNLDAWVFDTAKASYEMVDNDGDTEMTLSFDLFTHLDAGGADVMFALGTDYYSWDNDDAETSGTEMTLPSATIAVEAAMTDWATVRGYAKHTYIFSCSNDDAVAGECTDGGSYAEGTTTTDYGFGLGFDFGQLSLDMGVSERLFTHPMSTITGEDWAGDADGGGSTGLASGDVTITYSF